MTPSSKRHTLPFNRHLVWMDRTAPFSQWIRDYNRFKITQEENVHYMIMQVSFLVMFVVTIASILHITDIVTFAIISLFLFDNTWMLYFYPWLVMIYIGYTYHIYDDVVADYAKQTRRLNQACFYIRDLESRIEQLKDSP